MAPPQEACKVCMKLILDTDESIGCDSDCGRWFHRACVNVSKSEFGQLSKDSNKKWFCNRIDCLTAADDPIVTLTTSVNKLMDKINSWSDKIGKIAEVSAGIEVIKSDIGQIKDQLSNLEPRVLANETNIENLISEVKSLKGTKPHDSEAIIKEVNDRSQRAKNAIVYGIPESSSNNLKSKVSHDKDSIDTILRSLDLNGLQFIKVIRIGKQSPGKPRPIKITFANSVDAITFFKKFSSCSIEEVFPGSKIDISRDRTLMERSHLKELRNELEARKKTGEVDLTIRYQNGVPAIVKHSKN